MEDEGRDVYAMSNTPLSLFALSTKTIGYIGDQFPLIYEEMKKGALDRFKYQEFKIAHFMRHFISRAIDGNNQEFDVENESQITEIDVYDYKLERNIDLLDQFVKHNLCQLPSGVKSQGHGIILNEALQAQIERGYPISNDQIMVLKKIYRSNPVRESKIQDMIDEYIFHKPVANSDSEEANSPG